MKKENWETFAQIAVTLAALAAAFIIPPPQLDPKYANKALVMTEFLLAVILASTWVATRSGVIPANPMKLIFYSLTLLLTGTILYFFYQPAFDLWTCDYDNKKLTIGSKLTQKANEILKAEGPKTCSELIGEYTGKVDLIWARSDRILHQYILVGTYILSVLSFALSAHLAMEAVRLTHRSEKN